MLGLPRRMDPGSADFRASPNAPAVHSCYLAFMSNLADRDELAVVLARAFRRAWEGYYRPAWSGAASEEVARHALMHHLVGLAKRGVTDEGVLVEGGLLHLISLTPEAPPWASVRIDRAGARFLLPWRVQIKINGLFI
jgi:hypothetical protein